MKLSIITINYDDIEGLTRTAASVLREMSGHSRHDIQWILVDGESPSPCKDWIIANKGVFDIVFQEADSGIYDAMNKGLRASEGTHILFLNSGEELSQGALALLTQHLCSSEVTYLFGGNVRYYGKLERYRPPRKIEYARHSIPALHQATVYARTHIPPTGYDLTFRICGDHWLAAIILKAGHSVIRVHQSVCIHHIDGGAASRNIFATFAESLRVQREVLNESYVFCLASFFKKVLVWSFIKVRLAVS